MNQNLLFVIFLHYLSAWLIYFKTTTVHYMQNRHQILWKCFKKGLKFATISPQKDFTAETCCCYFLLAQHSEVPQNSTHLSIWNYFFSWKKHFRNHFIWDLNTFWSASKFSTVILNSGNGRFELLTLWRHKFTIQNHIWPWNRMRIVQNYNLSVPLDKRYKHIS